MAQPVMLPACIREVTSSNFADWASVYENCSIVP